MYLIVKEAFLLILKMLESFSGTNQSWAMRVKFKLTPARHPLVTLFPFFFGDFRLFYSIFMYIIVTKKQISIDSSMTRKAIHTYKE